MAKYSRRAFLANVASAPIALSMPGHALSGASAPANTDNLPSISARRIGPIITADMLEGDDGTNINGPSLIKVPAWIPGPLGAYYLYFAHHRGKYIRLAYADQIAGPWTVYAPGALQLADCPGVKGHVASPDIRIDDTARRILMYFHGPSAERDIQRTFVAHSGNALDFVASGEELGPAYSRNFFHDGFQYMVMGARGFRIFRSPDGAGPWQKGPVVMPKDEEGETEGRHCALLKRGSKLLVFYTRKGDAPESILVGIIDLSADWMDWKVVGDQVVLKPEADFEGASEPVERSQTGPSRSPENALRDPAIFEEGGRVWLVYAFAGEQGLAIAELTIGEF